MQILKPTSVPDLPVRGPQNVELYAYYKAVLADRGQFARQDFDPMDVPKLLAHLAMARVDGEPEDPSFHWTVFGTYLVDQLGWDLTGKTMSADLIGDNFERIIPIYRAVVTGRQPILTIERLAMPDREPKTVEVLHLPMIDPVDGRVERVLVGWCVLDHGTMGLPLEGPLTSWTVGSVTTVDRPTADAHRATG